MHSYARAYSYYTRRLLVYCASKRSKHSSLQSFALSVNTANFADDCILSDRSTRLMNPLSELVKRFYVYDIYPHRFCRNECISAVLSLLLCSPASASSRFRVWLVHYNAQRQRRAGEGGSVAASYTPHRRVSLRFLSLRRGARSF